MRVAVFVNQAEFHHRIVTVDVAFNIDDLVTLKMFLDILLENDQCVGEIDLK